MPAGTTPPGSLPRWELLSLAHFTGQANKPPRGSQPPGSWSSGGVDLSSECSIGGLEFAFLSLRDTLSRPACDLTTGALLSFSQFQGLLSSLKQVRVPCFRLGAP